MLALSREDAEDSLPELELADPVLALSRVREDAEDSLPELELADPVLALSREDDEEVADDTPEEENV